ncbi:hypothetical protein GCM10007108_08860 [Thermogymnomonas acidicola]|uniref:Chorismate-utilising enzyme C-terminal domain-containing protein n=1 Tax=Thermogymnomonas acidicola TaxID=399579 RepID=A0AA37BR32_9ARCH|nr:anthranilate synthase component I family protein [Thermogymnomonas acidicola]GGM73035.1 hypothetical protein GCM10007108_08860 [Thermogymnomonas acidicola]
MPLYTDLESLASGYRSFMYICRFDAERVRGEESLFLSSREPLSLEGGSLHALDEVDGETPVVVSYDFVSEAYPSLRFRRSGWPQVMLMEPDEVMHGNFVRERPPSRRYPARVEVDTGLMSSISEAVERIRAGELLQVVLSRRIYLGQVDPFSTLSRYMEGDRSLYVYMYSDGKRLILGSSPEKVVTRSGRELVINPIAGTRRRGRNMEEDLALEEELRRDEKELLEHRMLVDLARNDLGKVSIPGSVRVTSSMEVHRYASVQHLVSTVVGRMREGIGNLDVLRAVFPAGTVSGAPKERAMELIDLYEAYPRGAYSGAIGTVSRDRMDLALLIRTIFRDETGTYVQAGAGIVKDSRPEREMEEMSEKIGTIMGGVIAEGLSGGQP